MHSDPATSSRRSFLKTTAVLGAGTLAAPVQATATPRRSDASDAMITDVRVYHLPCSTCRGGVFVQITTDAGVSGWGEASPINPTLIKTFIETGMKEHVLGRSPFDSDPIWDDIFFANHDLGPGGALTYGLAGIDTALWDLKGKLLGVPVYKLLGGKYRDRVLAYGSFGVGGGSVPVDEAVRRAVRLAEAGFKVIKLRIQVRENNLNPDPDPTMAYARAVRRALPDEVELFIDPNEGYTAARGIDIGRQLADLGIRYYEAPVTDQNDRDLKSVVDALDLYILMGEKEYTLWQFRDLILNGNPDYIQPDVIKAGGITQVQKIAMLGRAFHKPLIPHNTKPTLGTAAALHLMASISNAGPFIEYPDPIDYDDIFALFKTTVQFEDGYLLVPEAPGLGLEVDEAAVRRAASAQESE